MKNTSAQTQTATVELTKDKDCKGSVRFVTDDIKAPVSNVYVNRAMNGINDAKKVRVTIEVIE
jgi:hypothetical protein